MAFSRDYLPIVGRLPGWPEVLIAGGYTGHGNAYALLSARMLVQLAQTGTCDDADLFAPERFASVSG